MLGMRPPNIMIESGERPWLFQKYVDLEKSAYEKMTVFRSKRQTE